jgi:hypothetical protein
MRLFEVNVLSGVRLTTKIFAGNAEEKLGPRHFHFQRIWPARSSETIPYAKEANGPRLAGTCHRGHGRS